MCRSSCIGGYSIAFGVGVLVANLLPSRLLLFVLAAIFILLGISISRR